MKELLFVYGTLRKDLVGSRHYLLASGCEYLSHGQMQGRLFEVKAYPGAIESSNPEDRVHGEVYRITDAVSIFQKLDEYEQCHDRFPHPHEYLRKCVEIFLPDSSVMMAWVYVYNHNVATLEQISSGDYLQYVESEA